MRSTLAILALVALEAVMVPACFTGGEREKDPPPGRPGGKCLAPDGRCSSGTCNLDDNYCFDPDDPCDGFFCGGGERGLCSVTQEGLPSCSCAPGYNNDKYKLYCCPDQALADPLCAVSQSAGGSDDSGG